jgi:hypothetical protein
MILKQSEALSRIKRATRFRRLLPGVVSHIYLADRAYIAPKQSDVYRVLDVASAYTRNWRPEAYDCDDFAWYLKAAFSEDARHREDMPYGWACGIIWGNFPRPHAVNWVLMDMGDNRPHFRLVEPQHKRGVWKLRKTDRRITLIAG